MPLSITAGLSPDWFTPDSCKDDPDPPQFLLAPLTSAAFLNAHGALSDGRNGDAALIAVEAAVKDWRNVTVDGQTRFRKSLLANLPPMLLSEIAAAAIYRSNLTEAERKN